MYRQPFMDAYVKLVVKTCHKRGMHAMGGMAAQIPIRNDAAANDAAFEKVRKDKLREAQNGHDGTWVAHPGLIPLAKEIFDKVMPTENQIHRLNEDVIVEGKDLISTEYNGQVTLAGVGVNVSVAMEYMEAWLRGVGCVPIHNLMEDAATAEISRSQLWQWIKFGTKTAEGETVTRELVSKAIDTELANIKAKLGDAKFGVTKFEAAARHLRTVVLDEKFHEFLTSTCYEDIIADSIKPAPLMAVL